MRSGPLWILAVAILRSGSASSEPTAISRDLGETFPVTIRPPDSTSRCELKTPSEEVIQFMPENKGDPEKYNLRSNNPLLGCSIDVKVTDKNDVGIWELSYSSPDGERSGSVKYDLSINGIDVQEPTAVTRDVGTTFPVSIRPPDSTYKCQLRTPSNEVIQFMPENNGDPDKYNLREYSLLLGCSVDIKVTGKDDEGIWELSYSSANSDTTGSAQYRLTVNEVNLPETTTQPIQREIEYLDELFFNTSLGETHTVIIPEYGFVSTESCHLESPEGVEYNFENLNIKGVKVIKDNDVACGIEIYVTEELAGPKWTLLSRQKRFSDPIEKRLNFTIYIEEIVKASPEYITIAEGSDLYVRLANSTPLFASCKLVDPTENSALTFSKDVNHKEECGFVVPNVQKSYTGRWEIVYGDRIIYKAPVQVTVNEAPKEAEISLQWVRDRPVDVLVGPKDAIYCRISSPDQHIIFEGFESCRITLDRVRVQHGGTWQMTYGVLGKVLTEERNFTVTVAEAGRRPHVITRVQKAQPEVLLTCSLEGVHALSSCKFREPSGRVLLAAHGLGEDRYSSHGVGVRLSSSTTATDCGLRITNPVDEDLGIWRCAMEADSGEVYYGFLTVLCSFATSQPDAAPVVTEPTLTAAHSSLEGVEGEAVTMACSVQSEIQYCYFRARNGTVYSVSPGVTSDMFEYSGAGFDAGECGIRFRGLAAHDSGAWSCHVGLREASALEQRATFNVNIQRAISTWQTVTGRGLEVTGQVYDNRSLEYCRFVRIDGLGFTSEHLPSEYTDRSSLSTGVCSFTVRAPLMLDLHPWTVAAKILGQETEVWDSTDHSLETDTSTTPSPLPPPPPPPPPPRPQPRPVMSPSMMWILITFFSLALTMVILNSVSNKPRQWASTRAASWRNSFRRGPANDSKSGPLPPPYTQTSQAA